MSLGLRNSLRYVWMLPRLPVYAVYGAPHRQFLPPVRWLWALLGGRPSAGRRRAGGSCGAGRVNRIQRCFATCARPVGSRCSCKIWPASACSGPGRVLDDRGGLGIPGIARRSGAVFTAVDSWACDPTDGGGWHAGASGDRDFWNTGAWVACPAGGCSPIGAGSPHTGPECRLVFLAGIQSRR